MIVGVAPTAERIAAISNGEQTIARAPAVTDIFASATALSSAGFAYPISKRSSSDREVRIVTAVTSVAGTASTAALTIARPPDACTVRNLGARDAIALAAPCTV